ncbi:hypothetical protein J6590_014353, partial [Homalodisca vitripennis]
MRNGYISYNTASCDCMKAPTLDSRRELVEMGGNKKGRKILLVTPEKTWSIEPANTSDQNRTFKREFVAIQHGTSSTNSTTTLENNTQHKSREEIKLMRKTCILKFLTKTTPNVKNINTSNCKR